MHIANMTGSGTLIVEGKESGAADYEIEIYRDRNMKTAEGTLNADFGLLYAAIAAAKTKLRLENGTYIDVVITNVTPGRDSTFVVSGPIPGY
jgi:hypothetical protein